MASLKELKNRKKSVIATKKITSAMKMIAAGKVEKSQDSIIKARPYAAKIKSALQALVYGSPELLSELGGSNENGAVLYIAISGDRGLCGGFNANINKSLKSVCKKEDLVIAVGNKIGAFCKKSSYSCEAEFADAFNKLDFGLAANIGAEIYRLWREKRIARVVLVYNRFLSAISQVVMKESILPISVDPKTVQSQKMQKYEFLTEPSPRELFDSIFPRYINSLVWRAILESNASENAARMTAMDNATENASSMIDNLTLQINKARQAAITQEIAEIVGGAAVVN